MKRTSLVWVCLFLLALAPDLLAVKCKLDPTLLYDYADQWSNIPKNRPPTLPTVKSVVKKQYFDIHVFFWDFKTADSEADCTCKIKIIKPDGTIYYESKELAAYKGKFTGKSVLKVPDKLRVCFEPDDQFGKYKLQTTVYDKIGKEQASAECSIELKPLPETYVPMKLVSDKKDKSGLAMNYYRNPQPEKLIPFFLGFCQLQKDLVNAKQYDKKRRHACNLLMAFCYYTFKNNQYLLPPLIRIVREQDIFYKRNLVFLLYNLNMKDEDLFKELGKEAEEFAAKLSKTSSHPFEFDKINYSEQEDILWAQFFATGKYLPIKKLSEVMQQLKSNMSVDKYKKLKTKTTEDKKKLYQWIVGLAARWSLQTNAVQHDLVFYYCETLFARDIKDRFEKAVLGGILQNADKIRFSKAVEEKMKEIEEKNKKEKK